MKKNDKFLKIVQSLDSSNKNLVKLIRRIKRIKKRCVHKDNQSRAKLLWAYEQTIYIHILYRKAYNLLKRKQYYESWCKLEEIENIFIFLKRHASLGDLNLIEIEKHVYNLQMIFPYRLFGSPEIIIKKMTCNICGKEIMLRNSCNHIKGEIYNGELCVNIIEKYEPVAIALVTNPAHKYSVFFATDKKTGKQIDQYNYDAVDYLFKVLSSPYEKWDLEIIQKYYTPSDIINSNDKCPCNSGKDYKDCCKNSPGIKFLHYEFIVQNPIDKTILTKTQKTIL